MKRSYKEIIAEQKKMEKKFDSICILKLKILLGWLKAVSAFPYLIFSIYVKSCGIVLLNVFITSSESFCLF